MASAARLNASTARLRGAAVEERKRKIAEASQVKSLMEKDELIDCVGALIEHVSPNANRSREGSTQMFHLGDCVAVVLLGSRGDWTYCLWCRFNVGPVEVAPFSGVHCDRVPGQWGRTDTEFINGHHPICVGRPTHATHHATNASNIEKTFFFSHFPPSGGCGSPMDIFR